MWRQLPKGTQNLHKQLYENTARLRALKNEPRKGTGRQQERSKETIERRLKVINQKIRKTQERK